MLILIPTIFSSFASVALAQRGRGGTPPTTKITALQQNYSGTTNHSLGQGSPGYGLEVSTDRGNTFLRYFLKGRVGYSAGRQNFLSANVPFASNYEYRTFAPEIGIAVYPVLKRDRGLNLYLWGSGIVSYNFLDITSVPTGSTVKGRDHGVGYGYGGGLGFEFMLSGGRSKSSAMICGEVGFRDERAQLVNENQFEISGMTFSLGFGF